MWKLTPKTYEEFYKRNIFIFDHHLFVVQNLSISIIIESNNYFIDQINFSLINQFMIYFMDENVQCHH